MGAELKFIGGLGLVSPIPPSLGSAIKEIGVQTIKNIASVNVKNLFFMR